MKEKKYFKQSINNWLHWHTTVWDKHISMRFAWKPSFLLEQFKNKYGEDEWQIRYRDLLLMLKNIWDSNKSPFVIYINKNI